MRFKSLKTKIVVVLIAVVAVTSLTIGIMGAYLNFSSSMDTLDKSMTEAASIAANQVTAKLEAYKNIALETGCVQRLSNNDLTIQDKREIIDQKIKEYGFQRGVLIDRNGTNLFDTSVNVAEREYFIEAMKGNSYISEPTISKTTGEITMYISAPVWQGGVKGSSVVAVVCYVPDSNLLNNIVESINIGDTGSAYMLNSNGLTIAAKGGSGVCTENTQEDAKTDKSLSALAEIESKMCNGENGFGTYSYKGVNKILAYAPIEGSNGWSIAVTAQRSEFLTKVNTSVFITAVVLIIFLILGVILSSLVANQIVNPIKKCQQRLSLLSHGDVSTPFEKIDLRDEVGGLCSSLSLTIEKLNMVINEISNNLTLISNGDLTSDFKIEFNGDFAKLSSSMKKIISSLNSAMEQINIAAEEVSTGSDQVSSGAQSLSQGATEQASSVQELAATINDISENVKKNAESAKEVSGKITSIGDDLHTSKEQMTDMIAAMNDISSKSNEIGKIIKTIEDIAFQTNILALNAAVEAARAGTAGKGFAVVADEVRNLASKSADAANETTALIESTIEAVEKGKTIADETANTILEVVEHSNKMIESVNEIAEASQTQAVAVSQVTTGVDQISTVIQTNSATAEESAAASEELSGQAVTLKRLVSNFKLKSTSSDTFVPKEYQSASNHQFSSVSEESKY